MGASAEDTERQIGQLRSDLDAVVGELERRLRGGVRSVAVAEARATGAVQGERIAMVVRENPTKASAIGAVCVGAAGFLAYSALDRWRESRKPVNRVRGRLQEVRSELERGLEEGRHRLDRVRPHELILETNQPRGGEMRVRGARLESPEGKKRRKESTVLKKLLWAGMLSIVTAVATVAARRVAASAWRATVGEEPPRGKGKGEEQE